MKLSDIQKELNAKLLSDCSMETLEQTEILNACGCDLMSDVLAYVKDQALLLTGLINPQVIRTAEMMDIGAICFVRGKVPTDEVIDLAQDMGIILLSTEKPLYTACGILYSGGLGGGAKC
ncbi:MAG: hypothetical protein IJC89_01415 [Clostridia bacterium]|nr:hypothetical protein [Clostridia bacterium]